MNTFHSLLDRFVAVYLNNLIIYTESNCLKDHIVQVHEVLLQCQKNGLLANMKKCEFHVNIIEYVGYIVSPAGLFMDPTKIRAIEDWLVPCTVKEVQSFLGFANFY
jgi:hypothetical protein